jgi:hypothetical protein
VTPTHTRIRWRLQLAGEKEELQALARMFGPQSAPSRPSVWIEDGSYYLHVPEFEALADSATVRSLGETWVARLNGLALLKFGGFRPVEAGHVSEITIYGGSGGVTVFPGTAVLYVPTPTLLAFLDHAPGRPAGMDADAAQIVASLPPTEDWTDAARNYAPDVDDALLLLTLAVRSQDWRLLYVVYEIIEEHAGQPSKMERLGWAGAGEIKRFKATADSRSILGTKSRHGKRKRPAPAQPMNFPEARRLVQKLLLEWLRNLAEASTPGGTGGGIG